MSKKSDQEIIAEGIVKAFPANRFEHDSRMKSGRLHKAYHSALAHAKTLSDGDLGRRVERHGEESRVAQHLDTRAKFFSPSGKVKDEAAYDKHIGDMEETHYKHQAYAYEQRQRQGKPHPDLDSFTPEYVDQQTKDRY